MAKKLTKEELEQDPLLQSYAKVLNVYLENKNTIIGAGIAVILAIGLGIGYYYYSQSQEKKAQQLMGYAEEYYMNGEFEKALTGSEEELTVGFEQIIDNYSGTDAANLARYYAAVSEYRLGNTQEAVSYMQEYEVPEGILGVGPLSFLGMLHTELGNHQQAAETYVMAAEWDKNNSTTPYNYLEAAHAYIDAGNRSEAELYAQKIVDEYPNSSEAGDARKLLGKLLAMSK